mmetsp:Transcript_28909/g.88647  ORF Transcript_28909/g.88647 Transcript_28909/m.88647 type:complete len:281 (+) Transcript_28909:577-1419(+)
MDQPTWLPTSGVVRLPALLQVDDLCLYLPWHVLGACLYAISRSIVAITDVHWFRDSSRGRRDGDLVHGLPLLQSRRHARRCPRCVWCPRVHVEEDGFTCARSGCGPRIWRRPSNAGQHCVQAALPWPGLLHILGHSGHRLQRLATFRSLHSLPPVVHPPSCGLGCAFVLLGVHRPHRHPLAAHVTSPVRKAPLVSPLLHDSPRFPRRVGAMDLLANGHHSLGHPRSEMGDALDFRRVLASPLLWYPHGILLSLVALKEQPAVCIHGRSRPGGRVANGRTR